MCLSGFRISLTTLAAALCFLLTSLSVSSAEDTTPLPASVDLRQFCPPVIDQKDLPSDVAWAAAYYQRGWYAKRDGYYPEGGPDGKGGFAAMYVWSQEQLGALAGSLLKNPYGFMWAQGVASREHYYSSDTEWEMLPNARHRREAQHYQIKSWREESIYELDHKAYLMGHLAAGDPVVLGVKLYEDFLSLNSTNHVYEGHKSGEFLGGHAVVCMAYDEEGIWIVNTFGTQWGLDGWAFVTWEGVKDVMDFAATMVPMEFNRLSFRCNTRKQAPGSPVRLSGSNFPRNATVKIYWDDQSAAPLRTVRTDDSGVFVTKVNVPDVPFGYHRFLAVVDSSKDKGKMVAVEMHVVSQMTFEPQQVSRTHTKGELRGKGFPAGDVFLLRWDKQDGADIATITVGTDGRFSYALDAALPSKERHKVVAVPEVFANNGYVFYFPYVLWFPWDVNTYVRVSKK